MAEAWEAKKNNGHSQAVTVAAPIAMAVVTATAVATAAAAAAAAVAVAVATATATAVAAGAAAAAVAAAAAAPVAKARANLYSHPVSSLSFCTPTLTIGLLLHPCLKLVHNCRGPATPGPPVLTVDCSTIDNVP